MTSLERALVVEDDPSFASLIGSLVASLALAFDTAASTEQAIQFISTGSYALICCDIQLGVDLLGGLRVLNYASTVAPEVPTLVCTQFLSDEGVLAAIIAAAPEGIIGKNLAAQELPRALDIVLRGGHYYGAEFEAYLQSGSPFSAIDYLSTGELAALCNRRHALRSLRLAHRGTADLQHAANVLYGLHEISRPTISAAVNWSMQARVRDLITDRLTVKE